MRIRPLAFVVGAWVLLQGIATIWPAFSKQTIPEWLSGQSWLPTTPTLFGWGSLVVGAGVMVMLVIEQLFPRVAKPVAAPATPAVGTPEWKREALAEYYQHALVFKNVLALEPRPSDAIVRDIEQRLNRMRDEIKNSPALFSNETSLAFNQPDYIATNWRQRVEENADHFMRAAHHKWKAWGGNRSSTPLEASGSAQPNDVNPRVSAAAEPPRLTAMRRLLREAATYVVGLPRGTGDITDSTRMAWVVLGTVPKLLDLAFLIPPTQDYRAYLDAEHEKGGRDFDLRTSAAVFLNRLSDRITADQLDERFTMPHTFVQFRETEHWPVNAAPTQ